MSTLFPNLLPTPRTHHPGPFALVAIERSLDKSLHYHIPSALHSNLQIGQRVRVPLGRNNKPTHGYVIDIHPTTDHAPAKIKPLLSIDDARILLPPPLLHLPPSMARHYCTPLRPAIHPLTPTPPQSKISLAPP